MFNAGLSLAAAEKTDRAVTALRAWKVLDGKSPVGLAALAGLLDKTGSHDAALAWLDAAQALPEADARRFAPLVSRAKALEATELYADAVVAYDAALALPPAADQARGEVQFLRGCILLLRIEDYDAGSQGLVDAWKAGYHDEDAWKRLKQSALLKSGVRLEADLKLAGVTP